MVYQEGRKRRYRLKVGRILITICMTVLLICIVLFLWKWLNGIDFVALVDGKYISSSEMEVSTQPSKAVAKEVRQGELILVNNQIKAPESSASDMISIFDRKSGSYYVRDKNVIVKEEIMEPINRMMDDFYKNTGLDDVMIISGFRDEALQQTLYERELNKTGLNSSSLVAKPGYSEHQTGYVIDLGLYGDGREFDGKGAYKWLLENAHLYGFVQRYQEDKVNITMIDNEPWHFRYVGIAHAHAMKQNHLCLEEYIDFLKNYPYNGTHLEIQTQSKNNYEIYYIPDCTPSQLQELLPKDNLYELSGNNIDGYIVTEKV